MQRLRHAVGAELGAEAAGTILRPVNEDAAARGTRTDAEPLPPVVPNRLKQRHSGRGRERVDERADPADAPRFSASLELRLRAALGEDAVELTHRPPLA